MFEWIDSSEALEAYVNKVLEAVSELPLPLAVDTEFIREHTYFPQVCLIQLAYGNSVALVDPIAIGDGIAALKRILYHPQIVKIFHAGRQDLEIFWNLFGQIPAPLYDTQIAAMVCGFGESVAYHMLVEELLGQALDKGSRFTEWALRPLTDKQCHYAADDVIYLLRLYDVLTQELGKKGREHWIVDEVKILNNPAIYQSDPDEVWKRIRVKNMKPKAMAVLQVLAREREREAIRLNVPRSRLLKDEVLVEMALQAPESADDMKRIRGLSSGFVHGSFGAHLIAAVRSLKVSAPSTWPAQIAPKPFPPRYEGLLDLLRMLLKMCADSQGVAQKLLANRHDLEHLILWVLEAKEPAFEHDLLAGWRHDIFTKDALGVIHGKTAILWQDGNIKLRAI